LIKNELRAKVRPIPENNVWIAAQAKQNSLVIVTHDAHFAEVDGLVIEQW
jgi:tRNA(fMet)-specific endonuclease VapC